MKYWLFQNNQVVGPYEPEDLAQIAGYGAESLVCPEGRKGTNMGDWQRASMVPELSVSILKSSQLALSMRGAGPGFGTLPPEPTLRDLAALGSLQERMSVLDGSVAQLQETLRLKDQELLSLHRELGEKNRQAQELALKLGGLEERLSSVSDLRDNLDKAVQAEQGVESTVRKQSDLISELTTRIEELQKEHQEIDQLREELQKVKEQRASAALSAPPAGAAAEPAPGALNPSELPPVDISRFQPKKKPLFGEEEEGAAAPQPAFHEPTPAPALEPPAAAAAPAVLPPVVEPFEAKPLELPPVSLSPAPASAQPVAAPAEKLEPPSMGGLSMPLPASGTSPLPAFNPLGAAPPSKGLGAPAPDAGVASAAPTAAAAPVTSDMAAPPKKGKGGMMMFLLLLLALGGGGAAYKLGLIGKKTAPEPAPLAAPTAPTETPSGPPSAEQLVEQQKQAALVLVKGWPAFGGGTVASRLESAPTPGLSPWMIEPLSDGIFQVNFYGGKDAEGNPNNYEFEARTNEKKVNGLNDAAKLLLTGKAPKSIDATPARAPRRPKVKAKPVDDDPILQDLLSDPGEGAEPTPAADAADKGSRTAKARSKKPAPPPADPEEGLDELLQGAQEPARRKAAAKAGDDEESLDQLLLPGVPRRADSKEPQATPDADTKSKSVQSPKKAAPKGGAKAADAELLDDLLEP